MIRTLAPYTKRLILTRPRSPRSAEPQEFGVDFPDAVIVDRIEDAVSYARRHAGPEATVLITGSLYLAGEARAVLQGRVPREALEQSAK